MLKSKLKSKWTALAVWGGVSFFISSGAYAVPNDDRDDLGKITHVEVYEITGLGEAFMKPSDGVRNPYLSWRADEKPTQSFLYNDGSSSVPPQDIGALLDQTDVVLDRIITIGAKVWNIVDKNQAVVNTDFKTGTAILPEGAHQWTQLSGWKTPERRLFRVVYKNLWQFTVIDFTFALSYTYGGSVGGAGQYLSNVDVEAAALDVAWMYTFTAGAEVVNTHNAGSDKDPVAAAEIRVNWAVDNVLKKSQTRKRFFVRGDGLFKNLSSGTLPAQ